MSTSGQTPYEQPEKEIRESFAGGAIAIEGEFNEQLDRTVEYVNIMGVRIRRRDPENDTVGEGEKAKKLPGFAKGKEVFKDLTIEEADLELIQAALMRYAIGHHTLFLGPPGFGKSRLVEFVAYLLNIPYHRVQCERGMNVQQQFLWTYVRDNGSWKGRLGPLPQSMQEGGLLLIDELPNLEPAERQVILEPTERPHNPRIVDRPPELHIQDFPGEHVTVQAAPGWFVAATGNYSEGQGIDEIHAITEREERRVRPYLLRALPTGTAAKRLAGRYRKETSTQKNLETQPERYYPEGLLEIPDEVIDSVAEFFEQVREIVKKEVLATARQEPKVFLNESIDRCFDHFMRFQIQQYDTPNKKERLEEILESALMALEFYLVNAFRDTTRVNTPQGLILPASLKKDAQGRVPARPYLQWRLRNLLDWPMWKTPENTSISIRQRLTDILGVNKEQLEQSISDGLGDIDDLLGGSDEPEPETKNTKKKIENLSSNDILDIFGHLQPEEGGKINILHKDIKPANFLEGGLEEKIKADKKKSIADLLKVKVAPKESEVNPPKKKKENP